MYWPLFWDPLATVDLPLGLGMGLGSAGGSNPLIGTKWENANVNWEAAAVNWEVA